MKDWKLVKCGNVIDVRDGTHDSPKYVDSGFPLVTSKNLINGKLSLNEVSHISLNDFENINKRSKVDIGDILYSMIGSIGNYALMEEEPNFAIKNVALFKFNNDQVFNKFFYHLLNSSSVKKQIENQQKGGTQKFVSLSILRNLEIPLPPLDTQKKIAAILDAADTYRQKTKTLIDKYDQLAQSLFLDMFGDPVANPKGWEKLEMKKLCSFKKESVIPENILSGTKYIGLECIEKEIGNILYISVVSNGELKSNKFVFDENYILYGKLRPYLNKVALPDFKGICSTDIIPIMPIKGKTNRRFICQIMRHKGFVSFAHERSSGANLPRISPSEIEKYLIINPPITLQIQFAERIQLIEAQKQQAQASLQKAEDLFNSLLQRAFKGELVQ